MTAVTAKPNTINWLATILSKAQGVFTAIGGSVDIGLECANIRREYDRLKAENEELRKQAVDGFWVPLSSHDRLKAENERLTELVDGCMVIVEIYRPQSPSQENWRVDWLAKALAALEQKP